MSPVIDSHVHLYPEVVSRDPAAWAAARAEPHWGSLVLPRNGQPSLQGWAGVDELLREMDRTGVDRAVLQGWYWQRQETCDWHNTYHAACVRSHPDRLSAFASIQPSAGQSALDAISRAGDAGFLGLGELCPPVQGGDLRDADWSEALDRATGLGLIVHFHADEMVGRSHAGRVETSPGDFQWVLEQWPDLRIILAHLGGGLVFHRLNRGVRKIWDRVWFDLAATPLLYDPQVYAAAVACGAGDRILFGSDFPLITHPRQTDQPDLELLLEAVRQAGLEAPQLDRILGGNAAELFGL